MPGTHGHGTTLSIGATTIGTVISITGPNQARDSIDISTMDSTDKWREFIPGMLDAGEVTFEVNYDAVSGSTADDLNTLLTATAETVTITFAPTGATSSWSCSGFITALGFATPFDEKITQPVTIKFTGAPTYTDAV